jgi:cell division protein FtsX
VDYRRRWYAEAVSKALTPSLPDQYIAWMILAIPALVLLVACTNLANLVLSRGASRRQELAIRQALGNSRGGVIRELLVEHAFIAAAAAGLGLLLARGTVVWLAGLVQESFGYLPRYRLPAHLEPAVVSATILIAIAALVISGLMPAIRLTRGGAKRLIAGHSSNASPLWRGRSHLIAGQVAISVGLLLITAFFVRVALRGGTARVAHAATD